MRRICTLVLGLSLGMSAMNVSAAEPLIVNGCRYDVRVQGTLSVLEKIRVPSPPTKLDDYTCPFYEALSYTVKKMAKEGRPIPVFRLDWIIAANVPQIEEAFEQFDHNKDGFLDEKDAGPGGYITRSHE